MKKTVKKPAKKTPKKPVKVAGRSRNSIRRGYKKS